MNVTLGNQEFFPGIGKIKFEGQESNNIRWLSDVMTRTGSLPVKP